MWKIALNWNVTALQSTSSKAMRLRLQLLNASEGALKESTEENLKENIERKWTGEYQA